MASAHASGQSELSLSFDCLYQLSNYLNISYILRISFSLLCKFCYALYQLLRLRPDGTDARTVVGDVAVENKIGDALVHRIIHAHHGGVKWRACIGILLLLGFAAPIDQTEARTVRLIVECQNRMILHGPNSIFSRLRREGIDVSKPLNES